MTSEISGIAAAPASTQHLISYIANTPDGETRGIATVAAVTDAEGRSVVPWAQLAAIPGFREGDVIDCADDEARPRLLGPGPDVPGHASWCVEHIDDGGDGQSLCWGEMIRIGGTDVQLTRVTGAPAAVWFYVEPQDQGEDLSPVEARERAAELREIAARLDIFADQAEAGLAVSL